MGNASGLEVQGYLQGQLEEGRMSRADRHIGPRNIESVLPVN